MRGHDIMSRLRKSQGLFTLCLLPMLLGASAVVKLLFNSPGWGDEINTADTAVNLALYGEWISHNWPYSYHPLHLWLLVPWLKVCGISHFTVCLFDVLWGVAACIAANVILSRRQILRSVGSVVLFDLLFWGGANFLWTILSGRIDTMVLFWTILTVDALFAPAADDEKKQRIKLGLYALALSLTGIYTIPLIATLWLVMLARRDEGRKRLFVRGLVCAGAGFVALIVVCGYFLWHQSIFRYLYTTFWHCSTLSGHTIGSAATWGNCYLVEPVALAGYVVVLAVCWWRARTSTNWHVLFFIGAIPGLMVLFGRYAHYYHWLFYLPTAVGLCWAWQMLPSTFWRKSALVAGIAYFGWCEVAWFAERTDRPHVERQRAFRAFMTENESLFRTGDSLVLTSDWYYYPALDLGLRPWVRMPVSKEQFLRTTEMQIETALNMRIADPQLREKVRRLIARMEKITSVRFPEHGYMFAHDERAAQDIGEILQRLGYETSEVGRHDVFRLIRFDRVSAAKEASDG